MKLLVLEWAPWTRQTLFAVAGDAQEIELSPRTTAENVRARNVGAAREVETYERNHTGAVRDAARGDGALKCAERRRGLRNPGFAIKLNTEGSSTEAPPVMNPWARN